MTGAIGKAAKTDLITSSFQGRTQLFNVDDFYENNQERLCN